MQAGSLVRGEGVVRRAQVDVGVEAQAGDVRVDVRGCGVRYVGHGPPLSVAGQHLAQRPGHVSATGGHHDLQRLRVGAAHEPGQPGAVGRIEVLGLGDDKGLPRSAQPGMRPA